MNIGTVIVTPIVVGVIPLIKVNQETISQHIRHRSNTYEVGILTIDSFEFHVFLESVLSWRQLDVVEDFVREKVICE